MKYTSHGFFTLVSLLIGLAIISYIYIHTSARTGGKTILQEGSDAIQKAEEVKSKLESLEYSNF